MSSRKLFFKFTKSKPKSWRFRSHVLTNLSSVRFLERWVLESGQTGKIIVQSLNRLIKKYVMKAVYLRHSLIRFQIRMYSKRNEMCYEIIKTIRLFLKFNWTKRLSYRRKLQFLCSNFKIHILRYLEYQANRKVFNCLKTHSVWIPLRYYSIWNVENIQTW